MIVQYEWNDVSIISNDDGFFRECHFFQANDLRTLSLSSALSGGLHALGGVKHVE